MKNLTVLILVAGVGVWLLSLSFTHDSDRADFTYVNPSDIHTLDPARMSWTQDLRVALNLWEGLTAYDPTTTEPTAGAALFPPDISPNGLEYTFHLRDDARWSNGDPVVAGDFLRGWRRAIEPGTAADYAFLITDHVAGAGEYAAWRGQEVAVLAALSRLRDGWSIDAAQAQALVRHPVYAVIAEAKRLRGSDDPSGTETSARPGIGDGMAADGRAWASAINESGLTRTHWGQIHRREIDRHAREAEERFQQVGTRAMDDRTFVVQLSQPCPFWLDLTSFPTLSPIHRSIDQMRYSFGDSPFTAEGLVIHDPSWTKAEPRANGYTGLITNGPYRLAEWRFKRRARLSANPFSRYSPTIAAKTVDMLVYPDVSTALLAYEAGAVDFLPDLEVSFDHELARLAISGERPDFRICPTLATYFLNFNCADETVEGRPNPFINRKVREAFCLAIDKRLITDKVLRRGDTPADSLVPREAIAGYSPPTSPGADPTRAQALLAEAGFPNGNGLGPIDFLYTPRDERAVQAIARMWEETLGVSVQLHAKESKTFGDDKAARKFMVARGNWYGDYGDPTTFLDCFVTGNGNNDSGYSNPEYDGLLHEASQTTDPALRYAVLQRAEALIVKEDFPIAPVLHYGTLLAIRPNVHGLEPNPRLLFQWRGVSVDHQGQ